MPQSQKIAGYALVTGARGFIGRHVARVLANRGKTVIGAGNGSWTKEEWSAWGISDWRPGDITLDGLLDLPRPVSMIVHCAGGGSVAFSIQHPLADFERTVTATAHVLEYARLHASSCPVVYPSSASVYGTVRAVPIPEDSPLVPISQYGTHKLMAEQMVASYGRQFHLPVSIVRLFSVYGSGLRKQLLWDACRKFASGDPIFMGTGDEVRDWLHVDDAADLLVMAAAFASPDCPIVNGGTGAGVSVREILTHLGANLAEGKVPSFSGAARAGDPPRYIADTQRLARWKWQPGRTWRQGIVEYARWWEMQNHGTR